MEPLARWVSNRSIAWAIVIVVALVTAFSLLQIRNLKNEDDVLAFLPQDNSDVKLFHEINKKFGGLDLALVGIEVEDPFEPEFLRRLQKLTTDLKDDPGLDHVLSLANVVDFTPDEERGGVITAPLIQHLPKTPEAKEALRAKVMSRDHVVGNLISSNGKAVLLYNFLGYGTDHKVLANRIQSITEEHMGKEDLFFGGGPFISTYIFDTTQRDLRRLTPWAVLAIVVIILLAFRDWIGATLTLLTTGIGISYTLGAMALFGVPFNIVLSAMPIILFAIGSAYGIHILSRYYFLAERHDNRSALARTLTGIGPVVTAAGLTTVVSLLSFVFMDIVPIRTFGFFTAFGILVTLFLSLTFIPAVVRLTNLKRKQHESIVMRKAMVWLTVFAQTHRKVVGVCLLLIAGTATFWISQVNTAVDQTAFFSENSPPDQAEKFLARHFGGGQFIQLFVEGDMDDPHTLREMRRVADQIAVHPHVSAVRHVGVALSLSNKAMVGQLRIPDTKAQVKMLYGLMYGDPAVAQLVSDDHKQGLVHIQVSSQIAEDLALVLSFAEDVLARSQIKNFQVISPEHPRWNEALAYRQDQLTKRLLALAKFYKVELPEDASAQLAALLEQPIPQADPALLKKSMLRFLNSEECAVPLDPPAEGQDDPKELVAQALSALSAPPSEKGMIDLLAKVLQQPADGDLVLDLAWSVSTPFQEAWRRARADNRTAQLLSRMKLQIPESGRGGRFVASLGAAFWDQDNPDGMLPHQSKPAQAAPQASPAMVAGALNMQVNGLPVLHRGLSQSVESNQIKSLVFAVLVVIIILSILFRSLWTGLLAASPTLLTLVIIYGGMGLMKVHLDIGTSMLASIILGVGVDYAVHLVAGWNPANGGGLAASAANAADHTGPAIWTNAIMIFLGFFVLTLGEARPLQNVGGLTSAAMLVAALATFLAIPCLARKTRYRKAAEFVDEEDPSEAVNEVLNKALPQKS